MSTQPTPKKPRNLRNFWIEIEIDGQARKIICGPRSKTGGFRLTVSQRMLGACVKTLEVTGQVFSEHLRLECEMPLEPCPENWVRLDYPR